jgi:hypothetical protein
MENIMNEQSLSPTGESFSLPGSTDYERELERLKGLVSHHRQLGREIVVVMGLGFVGAVMAAVVADAENAKGDPMMFVIGMQRPSTRSYWKIPIMNRGLPPVSSDDPEVPAIMNRCVNEKKTLIATFTYDALKFADVVVVDIQCDYLKESLGMFSTVGRTWMPWKNPLGSLPPISSQRRWYSSKQPWLLARQSRWPIRS